MLGLGVVWVLDSSLDVAVLMAPLRDRRSTVEPLSTFILYGHPRVDRIRLGAHSLTAGIPSL
ncbi:hypothetical protein DSL92_07640 [Billgrantia gudaonensis]|uniref:Uncharacterized protein n=1 Tax=Billgrantia gudaonensis TaxID=376427 RepID=A0A3S0NWM5_9GAMM|nr:hypothetical protein DSL92_07640 [Halomonas gudaonensis]